MNRKRFNIPGMPGNSKNEAENQKAQADSGMREISTREMEYISGGGDSLPAYPIPPEWVMKDE